MDFSLLDVYSKDKFILRSVVRNRQFPFIRYHGDNLEEFVSFITSELPDLEIDPQKLRVGELYTYSGKYFRLKRVPISDLRFVIASLPFLVTDDGDSIPLAIEHQQAEAYLRANRHHKLFAYEDILATYKYNPDHSSFMMYDRSHPNGVPMNGLPDSYEWYIGGDDGANRMLSTLKPVYSKALHMVDVRPDFGSIVYRIGSQMHSINKKLSIQGRSVLFNESWENQERINILKKSCLRKDAFKSFVNALYIIVFANSNSNKEFTDLQFVKTIEALHNYLELGQETDVFPISQVSQKYLEHNMGPQDPEDFLMLQEGVLMDFYDFLIKIQESITERMTIVGTVCQDDKGNLYCGKTLLSPSFHVYRGCKCEITSWQNNIDEKTKSRYPYSCDRLSRVVINRTGVISRDDEGTLYLDKYILKESAVQHLGEEAHLRLIRPYLKPRGKYLGEVIEYTLSDEEVKGTHKHRDNPGVVIGIGERWQKIRSLDDFDFVKEAGFIELHKRICISLSFYERNEPDLFCETSRRPLERAMKEVYQIAGIEPIPGYVADRIGNLAYQLPEELYPGSIHIALSQYNKLVRRYNHDDSYPTSDCWNADAEECYRLMVLCFKWVSSFRSLHDKYFENHAPIDYEQKLREKWLTKGDLPQFNIVRHTQMPDFDLKFLTALELRKHYEEGLESELKDTFKDEFEKINLTYENIVGILGGVSLMEDESRQALSYLESVREYLPKLIATRNVYSYFSFVHPILFCESWSPEELEGKEFSGVQQSLDMMFNGLTSIILYASKIVVGKLSADELARDQLIRILDNRSADSRKQFYGVVNRLPEKDKRVLQNLGNFRRFIILRDRGLLCYAKEKAIQIHSSRKNHKVNLDASVIEFCKTIKTQMALILAELQDSSKGEQWQQYYPFEQKFITDILNSEGTILLMNELKEQNFYSMPFESLVNKEGGTTCFSIDDYSIPEDLFGGKVDISHNFIPGLKNSLKPIEVFAPLFRFILSLGGICSNKEAGALLRVFTGYPVYDANEKAKWNADYHILYYLVKYMFTPKTSYVKMRECIDITYPSDDERQKAEKSPSSYAERISGSKGPSIIETLYRLSSVFPKPEDPITD